MKLILDDLTHQDIAGTLQFCSRCLNLVIVNCALSKIVIHHVFSNIYRWCYSPCRLKNMSWERITSQRPVTLDSASRSTLTSVLNTTPVSVSMAWISTWWWDAQVSLIWSSPCNCIGQARSGQHSVTRWLIHLVIKLGRTRDGLPKTVWVLQVFKSLFDCWRIKPPVLCACLWGGGSSY